MFYDGDSLCRGTGQSPVNSNFDQCRSSSLKTALGAPACHSRQGLPGSASYSIARLCNEYLNLVPPSRFPPRWSATRFGGRGRGRRARRTERSPMYARLTAGLYVFLNTYFKYTSRFPARWQLSNRLSNQFLSVRPHCLERANGSAKLRKGSE